MKKKFILCTVALFLFAVALMGCGMMAYNTIEDLKSVDFEWGYEKVFPYEQQAVVDSIRKVFPDADLKIVKEQWLEKKIYVFYTEAGPFLLRQGEVVRVIVFPTDKGKTKMCLYSLKKMPQNVQEKSQYQYGDQISVGVEALLRGTGMDDKYKELED